MKKIVALLLAMILVIGVLAACSPSAPAQTTPDPAPVSYTHLDVYKRQGLEGHAGTDGTARH